MSISKSAFSLSKDEYEGTGKRLFIGLVIGTAILLCVLLLLIWLVLVSYTHLDVYKRQAWAPPA